MNKKSKNFAFILLIIVAVVSIYLFQDNKSSQVKKVQYSRFLELVKTNSFTNPYGESKPIIIRGNHIEGVYYDKALINQNKKKETAKTKATPTQESYKGQLFSTYIPYVDRDLLPFLKKNKVKFEGQPNEESFLKNILSLLFPALLLLFFLWFFILRQMQSAGNKTLSFGKSRAKINPENVKKIKFKDVAGVNEAKEELIEVVDFLKNPNKFKDIGARIPKGVLLVGPPGTGKTLLARACAGEAGVPFFFISGSDFVEMFVGVGASRVRDLFSQAKKQYPCIVFIDEIDAVGRLRGAGLGGGHDEREQTLNQLLVEMDGFEINEGIIVIAATNRADVLDPALLRPGRFDRQVIVDAPDLQGRLAILGIHSQNVKLNKKVELEVLAKGTPGFTGADLANLINESALIAAKGNRKEVVQPDLEEARDKVLMGPERKSCFITEEEKNIIAYHEGGHALLSTVLTHAEPVHKVTIIPRGRALGVTQNLPQEERYMKGKNNWLDEICVLLGGRLAEEIQFKDITTGASNDIERATAIARKMVVEWGMSAKLGPINFNGSNSNSVFLGRDYSKHTEYSDEYARLIDEEIKTIISNAFSRGRTLIRKYKKALDKIAKALLDKETITGDEVRFFISGKKVIKNKKSTSNDKPKTATNKRTKQERKKLLNNLDVQPI